MKSPTTILNSIQMMKSNLKNDKQQLRIIKNNFSSLQRSVSLSNVQKPTKSLHKHQTVQQTCQQLPLRQIKMEENILDSGLNLNLKKECYQSRANKQDSRHQALHKQSMSLLNMRKRHQKQVKEIKQRMHLQTQNIVREHQAEVQRIVFQSENRQQQLKKYICILEGQLSSASKQIQHLTITQRQQTMQLNIENSQLKQKITQLQKLLQRRRTVKQQSIIQLEKNYSQNQLFDNDDTYRQNQHYESQNSQKGKCISSNSCNSRQLQRNGQLEENIYKSSPQGDFQSNCQQKINQFFQVVVQSQQSKHSDCCNNARVKYQKIVNKLIQQNSVLLSKIQKICHDNALQKKNQVKISNGSFPLKIQYSKPIVSKSNYNSQKTQRNEIQQSRGRKSIVYKISNVLASSNVSSNQNSKVSKVSIKNKKNIKYFRTQANQNFQNDQNIDFSNIRKIGDKFKLKNKSPVQDFYSRIQVEETVNFNKKQVKQFKEDQQSNMTDISDYQILDEQSKLRTIKGFVNSNETQVLKKQNFKNNKNEVLKGQRQMKNYHNELMKPTNKKQYINLKI